MTRPAAGIELRTRLGAWIGWLWRRRRRWFVHYCWSRWRAFLLDFFFLWLFLLSTTRVSVTHDLLPLVLRCGLAGQLRLRPLPSVS
jgi:hypothetical protein